MAKKRVKKSAKKKVRRVSSASKKIKKTKGSYRFKAAFYNFLFFLALALVFFLISAFVKGSILLTTLALLGLLSLVFSIAFLIAWLVFLFSRINK